MRLDRLKLFCSCRALIPGLERNKKERVITSAHVAQQTEADDAGRVSNPRRTRQDFFHISRGRGRAFQRSPVRKLEIDEGIALIFVRKEARWHSAGKKAACQAKGHEQHDHDDGLSDECRAPTDIALCCSSKHEVKPIEKSPQQSSTLCPWPEQQRGKRRTERERVERRQEHRNRDSDGELLVEPAGNAGDECCRHKYCGENQRDPDDRAGEFFHCFQGRVLRSQALLYVPFHAFDHDDGVVHDEADRQNKTKERKRIDGETEHREKHKCAYERDRYGQQRNQRGAPALQEKVDHKDHQREGDQKRLNDFLDAFRDRASLIERYDIVHIVREGIKEIVKTLLIALALVIL